MQLKNTILKSAIEKLSREVPRALLVGGYVRDFLLGREPKDADIEVYGINAEKLREVLERLFGHVDVLGESFGIYKVQIDGYELDISIPRRESKTGKGHKGFSIQGDPSMTVEEAMKRRDFTVNAMGIDVVTGEVVDPYHGRDDLERKILRVVDEKTFQDDPLRVYRAVQFAARFDFTIEEKSFALMRKMVDRGDLNELSKERITDEFKKLFLKAERPSIGFSLMRELGIIERHYPELQALIGVKQEAEWHPEGDVWIHTIMVIDEAARIVRDTSQGADTEIGPYDLLVMLAALCHDLGKPAATKLIEGRYRAFGHEEAGVDPTKSFMRRFTFGQELEHHSVAIVRDHLKPSILYKQYHKGELSEEKYANAVRRLLKRLDGVPTEAYLAVTEADIRGRGLQPFRGPYTPGDFMREIINRYNLEAVSKELLLSGRELIEEFGLTEGPKLGELIAAIEAARDEGVISTKQQAREFVYTKLHS